MSETHPLNLYMKILELRDRRIMLESMVLVAVNDLLQISNDDAKFEFNVFTDVLGDDLTMSVSFRTKNGLANEWMHIPCSAVNDYYNGKKDEAMEAMKAQRDWLHFYLDKRAKEG
jgi:hypothetical protein